MKIRGKENTWEPHITKLHKASNRNQRIFEDQRGKKWW